MRNRVIFEEKIVDYTGQGYMDSTSKQQLYKWVIHMEMKLLINEDHIVARHNFRN